MRLVDDAYAKAGAPQQLSSSRASPASRYASIISMPAVPQSQSRLIGSREVTLLPDVGEDGEVRPPGRAFGSGQLIEAFKHADAIAPQTGGDGLALRKMFPDRVKPDRPARKEAAGARGVGIIKHALQFFRSSPSGQKHPWNSPFCADLSDAIELALHGKRGSAAVALRQGVRRQRALKLQEVHPIFRLGEFPHTLDHELRQLTR